jgi:hypothetical protein
LKSFDAVHKLLPTSRSISFALLLNQYSDKGKRKSTQLVPTWGRFIFFDTSEINLREVISRINQGGSQLGKKYFRLFIVAGEEEICEYISVDSL